MGSTCRHTIYLRTRLQRPAGLEQQQIEIPHCDGPSKAGSRSLSQTNPLQGSSARLVGSNIYNSGVKLFSDAPLGIDPLLSLLSGQMP